MFDGVPAEQLHQFIASSRTSLPLPHPLPLPLSSFPPPPSNNSINTFPVPAATPFDPYNNNNPSHLHHHQLLQIQPHQLHQNNQLLQLHRQSAAIPKNLEEKEERSSTVSISINNNLEIERERSSSIPASSDVSIISDSWSNDELLALLRIRSNMEIWFPEFTWEHISRNLAELGFKRSAEKCKEKFEEESRYFNNINFTKNYSFLSDLEQLCQGGGDAHQQNADDHQEAPGDKNNEKEKVEKPSDDGDHQDSTRNETIVGNSIGVITTEPLNPEEHNEKEVVVETRSKNNTKKRKRQREFEMLKGFCEDIVNRMMARQEEMHDKLLEEMVKRNEEKLAREEAWKKQETDRMNKELEIMAREQAVAGDRQATITKFLKKLTSSSSNSSTSTSSSPIQAQNPNRPTCHDVSGRKELNHHQEKENNPTTPSSLTESTLAPQSPSSSTLAPTPIAVPTMTILSRATAAAAVVVAPPENPSSDDVIINSQNPSSISHDKQDLGKRWPRDEVLALINLRCSLFNNGGGGDQDKDGGVVMKAPLWERISQGMLEMGYTRSAKRCKEKWENINKYFRKTKDVNKKRSLDSRTCPYFHQLSSLYNQGILVPPSDHAPEDRPASPENHSLGDDDSTKHGEGEKNNNTVQQAPPPAFDSEF
ncbi:unnamed protein product [Malus baccata var. baccata]